MPNETIIEAFEQPYFSNIPDDLNIEDTVIYTVENYLAPANSPFVYGAGYIVRDITEDGLMVSVGAEFHPMPHNHYAKL